LSDAQSGGSGYWVLVFIGLYLTTCGKERKVSGVSVQVSEKKSKYQITNTKQITMTEIQNPTRLALELS
jgi:hypothetical protein